MQESDIARDALEVGDDVGREDHGGPEFAGAQDDLAHQLPAPDGIQRRRRLIEDQQIGRMGHATDQCEPLALTRRKLANDGPRIDGPAFQHGVDPAGVPARIEPANQGQHVIDAHP